MNPTNPTNSKNPSPSKTSQDFHYLKDFKELEFKTPKTTLSFELGKEKTKLTTFYEVERVTNKKNPSQDQAKGHLAKDHPAKDNNAPREDLNTDLFFHGEAIEFISVKLNHKPWPHYTLSEKGITLHNVPLEDQFSVEFENYNFPHKNTALDGLYVSGSILCTQCEPMGFRRITYAIDRPDNMTKIKTKISGNKKDFPFMLSNGNKIESQSFCLEEDKTKSQVVWEDPFPKPLYLFALVAGDLAELSDSFTTKSGKKVDLKFYCDQGSQHKCDFAIESLKKAMKWDEDRFGLEYDLDLYMVVAVDSFNMGAMENKGLNIFNSALVLADPKTATDLDYHRIESVIGHEYFHNWTGNRVTLKNWFQLTLKEGLTVFRDQEFSGDLNDRAAGRIDMVQSLKERQFSEDANALAHPIRPEKYKEMNNFYTSTVYEKGAEVVRMFHTLLGEEEFQKAMKVYFKNYDGQAITTEDFVRVMCAQDKRINESLITRWYSTPGTPHVQIVEDYDPKTKTLTLDFKQENKKAKQMGLGFSETYIPIKLKVCQSSQQGENNPSSQHSEPQFLVSQDQPFLSDDIFILYKKEQTLTINHVHEDFQVSYFQDFSAPVTYEVKSNKRSLTDLALKDTNSFNVYSAMEDSALNFVEDKNPRHLQTLQSLFESNTLSLLMKSHLLKPLTFNGLIEGEPRFDPQEIIKKTEDYKESVSQGLGKELLDFCHQKPLRPYGYTLEERGHRALYFRAMDYLLSSKDYKKPAESLLENAFERSDNMTTSFHCLRLAQSHETKQASTMSQSFYDKHHQDGLTLQKWIVSYLSTPRFDLALERIKEVESLKGYVHTTPNFIRSLWGSFISNSKLIHESQGRGYNTAFGAILKVDHINPQMSSAMMKGLSFASRLKGDCRKAMIEALEEFSHHREKFSSHLNEIFQSIAHELKGKEEF